MDLIGWNEWLLADVRQRARPGQRLYLYVDRDLLARLSGLEATAAVEDFCRAFRSGSDAWRFRRAADAAIVWKARGLLGEPTFVAHLAMTVLAVTEEPLGGSQGVYRRQNELLGFPAEAVAPPGYGEDVPRLWQTWNAWLEGPGSVYGRPSARFHPHWRLQGWARSQGLIRHHDRLVIDRFLGEVGIGGVTVALFMGWLRYRGAIGLDLLNRIGDEAARDVVQEVLDDEAEHFRRDGPRSRNAGLVRGLLMYDEFSRDFSGVVKVDPAWCGRELATGPEEHYTPDSFDDYLRVAVPPGDEPLLSEGLDHQLAPGLVVRFGGDSVYVMRDEPRVGGRLQCSPTEPSTNYHVLVHRSRIDDLTRAMLAAGLDVVPNPSPVEGWVWLNNVRLDQDSDLLRLLGLAYVMPAQVDRSTLEGGLTISGHTYICGGEPDLVLPGTNATPVTLDEVTLAVRPGQRRVSLVDQYPDPGEHVIISPSGSLTFRTVGSVRQSAADGGIARRIQLLPSGYQFDDPVPELSAPMALAGAVLRGIDVPAPLVIRRPPGTECLVLTESGDLVEIWPRTPRWTRRAGLQTGFVDALHAVRETVPDPAFLIVRSPRSGHMHGLEIPHGHALPPGRVPSRRRPDLTPTIVARRWRWVGPPNDRRASQVLARAIAHHHSGSVSRPPELTQRVVERRADVREGTLPRNAYDDVLTWLAEQENSKVSATRFAETWAWLCRSFGHPEMADGWRRALTTLVLLGHVERDFARQQVSAAPAALVSLPDSDGLSLLVGSRPGSLIERLDDPDDNDPAVAAAASSWMSTRRTPTDSAGRPVGPTAVYVEWDGAERRTVEDGLDRLGVRLLGCSADRLLELLPAIGRILQDGQQFVISPGKELWLLERSHNGTWQWVRRTSDTGAGFYRYRLAQGQVFAWRPALRAPLVQVEPAVGRWLAHGADGYRSILVHQFLSHRLLVPESAPLPALINRALTLRTGLPQYSVTGHTLEGAHPGWTYRAYENVGASTAERVADLLQQELKTDYGS